MPSRPRAVLRRPTGLVALVAGLAVLLAACSSDDATTVDGPAADRGPVIGFIFVGARDDLGYNQAAWEASFAVARRFPDATILREEHVAEDDSAIAAMEAMVDQGATILFATSFGHLPMARSIAEAHPDVTVLHQGGSEGEPDLPNLGTYFGAHEQAMFLAGIAAGHDTTTGKLGFVGAYTIPATYANANALLLGARSVRPDITMDVALTGDWCDPARQAETAAQLLAEGADVLAQHQDCTRTILEAAEEAGVGAVGYHYDGREAAPTSFLAAAIWTWEDVYTEAVATILAGTFEGSVYEQDFRGSLSTQNNPFVLSEPGPRVPDDARAAMDDARRAFQAGELEVFRGPIVDNAGAQRAADGEVLGPEAPLSMDWFVEGITVLTG